MQGYLKQFKLCLHVLKDIVLWIKHLYPERHMMEEIFGLRFKYQLLILFLVASVGAFFLRMNHPEPFVPFLLEGTEPFVANNTTWSNATSSSYHQSAIDSVVKPPDPAVSEYCRNICAQCIREEKRKDATRMAVYQSSTGMMCAECMGDLEQKRKDATRIAIYQESTGITKIWADRIRDTEEQGNDATRMAIYHAHPTGIRIQECLLHKESTFDNPSGNSNTEVLGHGSLTEAKGHQISSRTESMTPYKTSEDTSRKTSDYSIGFMFTSLYTRS